MRNKLWILLLLIHCFAVAAAAQNPAKRQLVMQVSNGGFVAWVLHDTTYTPLFGANDSPPGTTSKGPNVFEKIEGALANRGAEVTFALPGRLSSNNKTTAVAPQRVMVGGADSMEHLLPKAGP
jgi:hypothetical protein